jgi:fructose-1,6-bisphosphatase II
MTSSSRCSIGRATRSSSPTFARQGARIKLIGDGDLSAAIVAAVAGTGVHAVMGTGGAPEGVLTAVAMRCLNGEIYARLVVRTPEDEARSHAMGITDLRRVYTAADLAPGRHLIFAATASPKAR